VEIQKNDGSVEDKLRRGGVFIFVAALHILALGFIVFTIEAAAETAEIPAGVMKLADIEEEAPPPPPAPSPPAVKERPPVELVVNEPVAETVIEAEEAPVEIAAAVPQATLTIPEAPAAGGKSRYVDEYLPQNRVSVLPSLDEKEIRSKLIYPPIALRSGLEGIVYLELYIDSEGAVRRIVILKENPPGRGFGEAAVKAFEGLRGKPAQANGEAVGVRYRYPVRFQIK
jgi:protein TonB